MLTQAARGMTAVPVVWSLLGYPFEAGPMLGALAACLMVRLWVSLKGRPASPLAWAIDGTVLGLALLFTAGWVVLAHPSPFFALLGGTGFGALGAGIVAVALAWVRSVTAALPGTASAEDGHRG